MDDDEFQVIHCNAERCKARRRANDLMCRDHWGLVPKDIQRAVWQTWFAYQAEQSAANRRAYLFQRARAIWSVAVQEGHRNADEVAFLEQQLRERTPEVIRPTAPIIPTKAERPKRLLIRRQR